MTRLPILSRRECVSALSKAGYRIVRTSGDHTILKCGVHTVSIPARRDLQRDTLKSILRCAGLSIDEFNALRKG